MDANSAQHVEAAWCNEWCAFQNETGRLQLEGCVCDDYYRVRELLYEQFAIVWTPRVHSICSFVKP